MNFCVKGRLYEFFRPSWNEVQKLSLIMGPCALPDAICEKSQKTWDEEGGFLVDPYGLPGSNYKIPHQRWSLVPIPTRFAKSLTKHGRSEIQRIIIERFLHMVEIEPQHMHIRPKSSILMCVLKLRISKTCFRPVTKTCHNVQILTKATTSCRKNTRCQNPSVTVRIFEAHFYIKT